MSNTNSRLNNVNSELNKLLGSKSKGTSKPKSKTIFIIIGVILLLVILGVVGYFLYRYFSTKNKLSTSKLLVPYIRDASVYKSFSESTIPGSLSGNEYNINMWIYINDYLYRSDEDKCILFKGDIFESIINGMDDEVNENGNPSVWLKANENTLVVQVGLDTSYNKDDKIDKCEFKNMALQKWVNLNISLRNNVLDIFIDGTLVKSCILKGTPAVKTGDLHVCKPGSDNLSGFNGYISRLEYTNMALDIDAIMNRYKKGPVVNIG